jgi:hypothetical protein
LDQVGRRPLYPRKRTLLRATGMSALGQKRTLRLVRLMSALPPKADIAGRPLDVCFVPQAAVSNRSK